jgi:hypothetical protein
MAPQHQRDIFGDVADFCDAAKLFLCDEVEQMMSMYGVPTPCPHPSIQQIEKDIDTLGRLAFTAATVPQTRAIQKLLNDLQDAIPKLQKAREWEMHHMTWTIHEWSFLLLRPSIFWEGVWSRNAQLHVEVSQDEAGRI